MNATFVVCWPKGSEKIFFWEVPIELSLKKHTHDWKHLVIDQWSPKTSKTCKTKTSQCAVRSEGHSKTGWSTKAENWFKATLFGHFYNTLNVEGWVVRKIMPTRFLNAPLVKACKWVSLFGGFWCPNLSISWSCTCAWLVTLSLAKWNMNVGFVLICKG